MAPASVFDKAHRQLSCHAGASIIITDAWKISPMLIVNERGLYQVLLFKDRRPEARQFTDWVCNMLEHMRTAVGLQPYEALRMTEPKIRCDIDEQLDDILAYNKE